MDYEIMLTTLASKKEELDSQKSKVESAIEESSSTLSSMGKTPIASLYNKIQDSTDNVKKAYTKTGEWFDKYVKELNELENSLATFSCNGIEAPTEFKDNFVDIFGKKLIPTLRAGGDPKANMDLGIIGPQTITIDQVRNCKDVQEYLDLVMPIYNYYCKKYGIKYPGVLALQPVYEHSAPTGIHAESAIYDNNLGGLKYNSSIPNATPGSTPGDGTGGIYSHFNNITEYIEAACWNIAEGSYYTDAMAQNNMDNFAISLVNTWVGHDGGNYGPELVQAYKQYGLEKYELN